MDDKNYLSTMQQKENLCLAYMQKADDEYFRNNQIHTNQECIYLQKAANLRSEMARISVGDERAYQSRKLQELNKRIEAIIRILDPDLLKRMKENTSKVTPDKGGNSAPSSRGDDIPDEDVASWFKDAPKHSFKDVAGMNPVKEQLRECIKDAHMAKLKEYLQIPNLSSYFFIGPPGCGKTYIIRAFAHELMDKDYKFLSLVGSDILSRFVGEAEKIVTRLFEEAEKNAPCIVFIDEIDGVCKNRSLPNLPEYAASITTAFLTGYNQISASDKPIIFIGATNYPNQVDNAMLDRVELIRIPFPDKEARTHAFKMRFSSILTLDQDITFEDMAEMTDTYNYRDIDRLINKLKYMIVKKLSKDYSSNEEAAIDALSSGSFKVDRAMFTAAKNGCLPTPKDSIIKALDEWEESFNNMEEE